MSAAAPIAGFLASVFFESDNKSMEKVFGQAKAFGLGLAAVATGAIASIISVASSYDTLGRTAENLRMPVEKLQELNYVAEQTVGSSDAVAKSLEGIVAKNPRIKDAAKALEVAGDRMKKMSKAGREAYASRMGIDPALIPMLIKDVSGLKDEFQAMYATAGTDAQAAAAESRGFMAEIGKFLTLAQMLANAVSLAFIGRIRRDIERLRKGVIENFDKIKRVLEAIISFALRMVGAIAQWAGRIIGWVMKLVNWFSNLDRSHQIVIAAVFGLLAAWKLLNAGFLATPIGWIVGGLVAIVGLVDDYLTYMEGGASYFDWGPWEATINECVEALRPIAGLISGIADGIVAGFRPAFEMFKTALSGIVEHFKLVFKFIGALFSGDLNQIMAAGEAIIDNFINTVVGIFGGMVNTIAAFFAAMWPSVQANFSDFAAWAEGAAGSITSFFGKAIKWVEEKLSFLTEWMPDWLKDELGIKPGDAPPKDFPPPGNGAPPQDFPPPSPGINRSVPPNAVLGPSPFQQQQAAAPVENNVDLKQQTTINVYSNGDPQAVGAAVAGRQGDVNGQMVRTTKGAIR